MRPFALVIAGLYLAATAALFTYQRSFFYLPRPLHLSPSEVGLTRTKAEPITTSDGVRIEAWYSPAPEGEPTLVFFHGNGGLISAFADRVRYAQAQGYGIMLVEYRGYGGSGGSPTEEGLYADGRAALDWLAARGVASTSTFLYGESLGTGIAVKLATERPVAGVILESPYTSAAAVGQIRFWMFPVSWLIWDRYDSLSRIKDIHAPLLVMHGGNDSVIPQSQGRALFEAAAEPKLGYFPLDAHHVDLARYGGDDHVADFIAKFWRAMPKAADAHAATALEHPFAARCEIYSPPAPETIDAIIKRSSRIAFAEVSAVRPNPQKVWHGDNVIYTLRVIETLKGEAEPYILQLPGVKIPHAFPIDPTLLDVTYRHAKGLATAKTVNDAFTAAAPFGVVDKPGFCEYAPHFDVGMTYLIFLPDTFTSISFEPIVTQDDPWYERVRGQTGRWGLY